MGAVYEAEQLSLERRLAVKVISPELSSSESFRARFADEAKVAASLDHPNILPVHETGVLPDGRLYIAMRMVQGVDLGTHLRTARRLPAEEVVQILVQVGDALDAAHEAAVIHRDVKPGNVLLEQRLTGTHAWLTDFGLAKREGGGPRHTETGELLGTVDYMAPEQIEGVQLTSRVDVYAFGCMAYRCLTGEVPFPRESRAATLLAHANAPTPRPSGAFPGTPEVLDILVSRAMEKDPSARAASAGALARWARGRLAGPAGSREGDATRPAEGEMPPRRRWRGALVAHVLLYAPVWAGAYLLGRSL